MRPAARPRVLRSVTVTIAAAIVTGSVNLGAVPVRAEETPAPVAGETVVGEFTQVWPEFEDADDATARAQEGPLSYVRTEDGDSVRLDTADVEDLDVGDTVEVTVGDVVTDAASTESGYEPAREVLASEVLDAAPTEAAQPTAPASPPYTHDVTVVLVNPAGGTRDGTALADVVAEINGPVADFWQEQSNDLIKIGVVEQHDWIDTTATCEDPYDLWYEVADTIGWDTSDVLTQPRMLMLYVTGTPDDLPGCAYGLSEVGSFASNPGRFAYARDVNTSLMAHEIGHTLGLGHSSAAECSASGFAADACDSVYEYGDFYDVMGHSWDQLGSLNVVQSEELGSQTYPKQFWVSSPAETVTLEPISQRRARPIELATSENGYFWLEYRPAVGRDAWLGTSDNVLGLQSGVLLRRENYGDKYSGGDTSMLLDATPSPESAWDDDLDFALPVGEPIRIDDDRSGGGSITVTVESMSPTGASIRVVGRGTGSTLPTGNWEAVSTTGHDVTVSGWAIDTDTRTEAAFVDVYVDDQFTAAVAADDTRADVGAAFPGAGNAHGFSWSGGLTPGTHQVCLSVVDAEQTSRARDLGCRTVGVGIQPPKGNFEVLSASGSTLTVAGWAFDPDAPTTASQVHVYVDSRATAVTADTARADVGAAFGVGSSHGFNWSGTVAPGAHSVCVYAIDLDQSWRNTPLGCRSISTQVALPSANWEVLSAVGSSVTVAGWAVDTDSPTGAVPVHVYVDGQGTAISANGSRPDVGAVFAGAGNSHGFSWTGTVAPGVHKVCAYAIDPEFPFRNSALGCRSITTQLALPVANWEVLSASGSTVTVAGWTFDADSPASAVPVHVYVDGQGTAISANGSRPDVGAYFGVGASHGFIWSGTVAPGRHTVCVYAIDADLPWRNAALGCRAIDTQVTPPRANWEVLSVSGSTLTVSGWALDPDSGTSPSDVHVYVDGQGTAVTANGSRTDVGAAFPGVGDNHGFSHTATVAAGSHRVCLYAIDGQIGWVNTPLGCRTVSN